MKIYTRTGDAGTTNLVDGARIAKSDPRVDACGEVDEANAVLGLVRALSLDRDLDDMLVQVQRDLFALGSRLADPAGKIATHPERTALGQQDVVRLEGWIDRLEGELTPLRRFILPGGAAPGAALHVARTVFRRAERRIVALGAVEPLLLAYANRLSDLFFVMARVTNARAGVPEVEW
ncbi:MAG: cob(I)yrinic acid a,c-diamide adenosyltransferase [Acidobacteria bacterium]|nr:cob(I)yrinic acid a,c-diamide adenosyltransferase [Acidobacteriota bacterium]